MAILKAKDVAKMQKNDRLSKLSELKMELIKANVLANKTNAKTKEIKRAIARLLTFNNSSRKERERGPVGSPTKVRKEEELAKK